MFLLIYAKNLFTAVIQMQNAFTVMGTKKREENQRINNSHGLIPVCFLNAVLK